MDKEIREKIDALEDDTNSIYKAEEFLLRRVFEISSDVWLAKYDEDFCKASGGLDYLNKKHESAVSDLKEWYEEGRDPEI